MTSTAMRLYRMETNNRSSDTIGADAITDVTYSKRFSRLAGKPTGPLSAEQAHKRHASGEPYAVTLGEPTSPDAVIDVVWKNDHVGVWFYDEKVRPSVHFSFDVRTDRLFLEFVTNWKYPDGAVLLNQAHQIEEVRYTPKGIVRHERKDKGAGERIIYDISDVDVSLNWERIPEFGNWDSIARFDRE